MNWWCLNLHTITICKAKIVKSTMGRRGISLESLIAPYIHFFNRRMNPGQKKSVQPLDKCSCRLYIRGAPARKMFRACRISSRGVRCRVVSSSFQQSCSVLSAVLSSCSPLSMRVRSKGRCAPNFPCVRLKECRFNLAFPMDVTTCLCSFP